MKKSICYAVGCNKPIPRSMLMCKKHWAMVPKPLQAKIYKEYGDGRISKKLINYWNEAREAVKKAEGL